MILQELVEVAKGQGGQDIPLGCKSVPITAYLHLDSDGNTARFQAIIEKGQTEWGPYISPTNSGKPGLGIHKLEHLIGYRFPLPKTTEEAKQAASAESKRPLTQTYLECCAEQITSPGLEAVCAFLRRLHDDIDARDQVQAEIASKNINTGLNVAVLVDGVEWFQAEAITDFWRETGYALSDGWPQQAAKQKTASAKPRKPQSDTLPESAVEPIGECLACGQTKPLARLMDIGLDGFRDKPKLVSFNRRAYSSRGLEQTYNAPLCKTCAELAPKGWNELIRREDSHTIIGDHQYVIWGEKPEIMPQGKRNKPLDPKTVLEFIHSGWHRQPQTTGPKRRFRLLGLGSHKATAFVVAFLSKDADDVKEATLRWWRWQNLLGSKQPHFFAISDFVRALRPRSQRFGRNANNEGDFSTLETKLARELFMLSLGEGRCPPSILPRLSDRFATEPESNVFAILDRLALLEICLHTIKNGNNSNTKKEVFLEPDTPDNRNAFNAGRIFSIVVDAQASAIGKDTGKTLLSSYAHMVAYRPQNAIPKLVTRFHQVYYKKLKRDNSDQAEKLRGALAKLLVETVLASSHTPEQMGWFWKGFYALSVKNIKNTDQDTPDSQKVNAAANAGITEGDHDA